MAYELTNQWNKLENPLINPNAYKSLVSKKDDI